MPTAAAPAALFGCAAGAGCGSFEDSVTSRSACIALLVKTCRCRGIGIATNRSDGFTPPPFGACCFRFYTAALAGQSRWRGDGGKCALGDARKMGLLARPIIEHEHLVDPRSD